MDNRIVEINGVKLEVDMRTARNVEHYKVGDNVKVLKKKYSDTWESYPGVIVGFDNFKERPTIVVAYIDVTYNEAKVAFLYMNKESKDVEICPMIRDELLFDKGRAIDMLDKVINEAQAKLDQAKLQKEYFMNAFGKHFDNVM